MIGIGSKRNCATNSRELASKNEEFVNLRNMKESLTLRKASIFKESEKPLAEVVLGIC